MYEQKHTLSFVIAGGRGSRLGPLTENDSKPMLSFGGKYRLIDFVMSNLYNSELKKAYILTQYHAGKLNRHVNKFWGEIAGRDGMYIAQSPQETLEDKSWYEGTANAIAHNLCLIKEENPKHVAIFGADNVYMMDIGDMLNRHAKGRYDLTISALEVPYEVAKGFGVFEVDVNGNFIGFEEKPENPKRIPGKDTCLASMGNYIFEKDSLIGALNENSNLNDLDFGKHIIPYMIDKNKEKIQVYNFNENEIEGIIGESKGYWRDVGTIDSYYNASMELLVPVPKLNLYNDIWPIFSDQGNTPPARTPFGLNGREGSLRNSYITGGCTISGGTVSNSVVGPLTYVDHDAEVFHSVLFDRVKIGDHAKLQRTILGSGVIIPPRAEIGFDEELDRRRGFIPEIKGSPSNIRVITRDMNLEEIISNIR